MANEISDWKQKNCSASLKTNALSNRETFSREINMEYGGGGGLNANYRTAEAIAKAANAFGLNGLKYGEHFVFKTGGPNSIIFDFCDENVKTLAKRLFSNEGAGNAN